MINNLFYTGLNLTTNFRIGLNSFPRREFHKVVSTKDYTVQYGDNAYSLAKKFFGENKEYLWTYICDINNLRLPFSFTAGETIKIPTVAISETTKRIVKIRAGGIDAD